MDYQKRIIDDLLVRHLASAGAVVLQGPRAVGKTRSAQQIAKSEVFLDVDQNARLAMAFDPTLVLEGARPRLLDEWQEFPELWNFVRRAVDASTSTGQFLLTGSALPITNERLHAGAGRFSSLTLRPMSLFELGQSNAAVSFGELARGGEVRSPACVFSLRDVAEVLVRGGWPAYRTLALDDAARANRDYLDVIRRVDIQRVTGSHRDPERLRRLLISLARNVSTEVSLRTLAHDVGGDGAPLAQDTLRAYLDALRQLFILEDLEAWSPRVRSRTTLRSAPKRHFVDPSLAVAALSLNVESLLGDLEMLGLLFESLVIRDLRVLSQPLDARLFHYRDKSGLEVDAVVELPDRSWVGVEVKLGQGRIDEGAATLKRFAKVVDTTQTGHAGALVVVTAQGFGYRRDDGVYVVPLGALAP